MNKRYIASPTRTKEILAKHDIHVKKSLGQNFMIDANVLTNIIDAAGITPSSNVIEVGPGIGALTEQLAIRAKEVLAFEIDQRLLPVLKDTLADYMNIHIRHEDILEADVNQAIEGIFEDAEDVHLVANLPYYITTPIIMQLLQKQTAVQSMTVLLQKEVAERMAAVPDTKAYGSLSIAVQYYTKAKLVTDVPKTAFMPQPNVVSSVLKLERRKKPLVDVPDDDQFFELVQTSFRHRRKNIKNNFMAKYRQSHGKAFVNRLLESSNIEGTRRGESLSIEEFAVLANKLHQMEQV